jgi:hypothetical protein
LATDVRDTYRAGALLLRGSPFAVGWFAGWLTTEFSPQVVTGHALSRVTPPSIGRVAATWAAQRADQTLAAALEESFGPDSASWCAIRPAKSRVRAPARAVAHAGPHRKYARQTSDISTVPVVRHLLDV